MSAPEARPARSPYKRYAKKPYIYLNKSCAHSTTARQSTPTWNGVICTRCNIILKNFADRSAEPRFQVE